MSDRITLFISRAGAERAAADHHAKHANTSAFIVPATLRDDDTGQTNRGFRVVLINTAGHPVGSL
jgi:hypothetical protein